MRWNHSRWVCPLNVSTINKWMSDCYIWEADRSMAPIGVRTVVMSPGFGFEGMPSKVISLTNLNHQIVLQSRKYSFKMETSAKVNVDYLVWEDSVNISNFFDWREQWNCLLRLWKSWEVTIRENRLMNKSEKVTTVIYEEYSLQIRQ